MGENHCFDQADSFRDGGSNKVRSGGDDICDEEQGSELALWNEEFESEEVSHPGGSDETGG